MEPDRRPPRLVRALVLVGAIACLGLAMCAHADHAPKTAPTNASAKGAPPDAAPTRANDPAYFPATKAAGPIYPQQGD
jgi:hypothetical protein